MSELINDFTMHPIGVTVAILYFICLIGAGVHAILNLIIKHK